ncbi:MAG TPA: metalloregulator ArsR/SmtB family transcription factor [Methylomusa anaerophila]|uniref:Bacterial regulatory protein, arsR family n=1 Tax=Methylomusa anaerophila TaxID=1930071 RepID=A0A348AFP3_9FIRM|nr:metalloregulator ArsR/SmtB family transcription factor [Methylomusa anaerophila]BBB89891.1 bacterial regulatory protein, arsR family [Methylomusa anaerophila]HML90551.1 metalloregulator ArsR/SmtB family transcription factor [Methylomusa anaerophila]
MDTIRLAKVLKALSHPKRLELFFKIAEKSETGFETDCECECFVTDIMNSLKIGAPTISHHIKELENAGLIITDRKGKYLTAKVREETLAEVNKIFDQLCKK